MTTQNAVRISAIDPKDANGKAKELLDAVKAKLGIVPNMMRTMAHSPAALAGYLQFSGVLATGVLDAPTREGIALAVGQANQCEYCVSAHTFIGSKSGVSDSEILQNRKALSASSKTEAILKFAVLVVKNRGAVNSDDLVALRNAGATEAEIAEVIANVALNIFTNYFNHIAQTEVDFTRIQL